MRAITSSILAGVIALSAAAPAFAEPQRYGYDRRDDRRDWRDDRRDHRWDSRWDNNRRWNRGDRWDRRDTRYVVVNDYRRYRDYRGYHLRAPRYGEYYVRDHRTGDILLIAAATGLVLWALNN